MSSSTEVSRHVLRGVAASGATVLPTPELRDGAWTRFGTGSALGDAVTEQALAGLAEATRQAARAQGYATGWAEGRRAAAEAAATEAVEVDAARGREDRRREAERHAEVEALRAAASGFLEATYRQAVELEDHALHLARELSEAIVGHELRSSADPAGDVVRRALAVLPGGAPATVRLHPDVAATVSGTELAPGVTLVADATLGPADALVETPTQVVDLSIEAALDRVRQALA
ncbi:FliH/SctL family protein [Nocardioides sp.]|uniref:FliH/SctL family protein n=1 Tax=Nocardioides sp. TaxID=35761 RepID=UPI002B275099|nr:FliH/SctL family protein [Nocardioides sp.]